MDTETLRRYLVDTINAHETAQTAMAADKPAVTNGHSDGKRVRYVRHETAAQTLRDILALLDT